MKNKIFLLPLLSFILMPSAARIANAKTVPAAEQWTESTSVKGEFGWGNYEGTQASISADSTDKKVGNVSIKYSGIYNKSSGTLGPALIFPKGHYLDASAIAGGEFAFDVKASDLSGLKFLQLVLMSDGVQAHQVSRNLPLQEGWNHFSFPFPKAGGFSQAGWNGKGAKEFNPAAISQIRFRFIYGAPAAPRDVWFDGITFTDDKSDAQKYSVLAQKTVATDVKIAPGETWKTPLPALDAAGDRLLKITVRRDNPQLGGYGAYLYMAFNGEPLDASQNRYVPRLVNKPLSFFRTSGQEVFWNQGDGIWQTIFAPDFQTSFKQYSPDVSEPYTYLLDVSDLVKPGQSNTLELSSYVQANLQKNIVVDAEWIAAALPGKKIPAVPPAVTSLPNLNIASDGALQIALSGKPLMLQSSFSVPGGGQNHFGNTSKESQWQPKVTQINNRQWRVEAAGKYYRLSREITQKEGRIEIADTFHNLTKNDIGVIFSNDFNLKDQPGINYARIGGKRGQGINNVNSRENPTLFFPLKNSSLTMVVEDDVYRNQASFYFDTQSQTSGIRDNMFALAPHASYTMKWSIYTLPDKKYFSMVNRVRQDWGSNITLKNPVYFTNYHSIAAMTVEQIQKLVDNLNAKYICFWQVTTPDKHPQWDDKQVVAMGEGILHPDMKQEMELVKEATAKLHAADLDVKVALYTHSFFVAPEKADDLEFKDSWITNAAGERSQSVYDNAQYYSYRPVFPTDKNSYGKAYHRVIDYLLNDVKLDWIYWDESNGPGVTVEKGDKMESYLTYNTWDGHTAKVNPQTGMIEQKCGFLTLLSGDYMHGIVKQVKDHGGYVLFNGAGTVKSRLESPSFVESQWGITRLYSTNLNTPLAYGLGDPTMADLRRRLDFGTIYARTALDYKSDIVKRFYPFTPMELHEGWVKGKERIITDRSGDFGWDENFSGKLYLYDAVGKLQNTQNIDVAQKSVSIVVPDGGIAILERILQKE